MNSWHLSLLLFSVVVTLIIVLPSLAWAMRAPFFAANDLQWRLTSPLRQWLRDPRSPWPRRLFLWLMPFSLAYNLLAYLLLIPLRLVNALYFDVLLYWSVSLRDGLADLAMPRYPEVSGYRYVMMWFGLLPLRLAQLFVRYALVLAQGLVMLAFDIAWPSLTMFHGTDKAIAETIARTGEWYVGGGNYAGTGVYFGLRQSVAEHYARTRPNPLIVMARVTLAPCRPIATLRSEVRNQIGHDGDTISREIRFPWASVEHWRTGGGWYEFCLAQTSKYNHIQPWRVRPICIISSKGPERVVGGLAAWPRNRRGYIVVGLTLLALLCLPVVNHAMPLAALGKSAMKQASKTPGLTAARLMNLSTQPPAAQTNIIQVKPSATLIPTPLPATEQISACPAGSPLRIQANQRACVVNIGADKLRLRSAPSILKGQVLARLTSGTAMTVLDGPACAENYTWWQVQIKNETVGWIAESGPGVYFLRPCD